MGETVRTLAIKTTFPGFSHAVQRKGCRAWVWMVIGVASLVATWVNVWTSVDEIMSRPTMTRVAVESQANLSFPSVTVCTLNKLSCKRVANQLLNVAGHSERDAAVLCKLYNYAGCDRKGTILDSLKRPCGENVVDDFYTEEDMLNENITNVMEDLLAQDYNAMDLSLQYTIAPQFDDMMVRCTFNDIDCGDPVWVGETHPVQSKESHKLLSRVVPRYGLCVDFNHFNNSFPKDVAVDTGLKLILKIDVSDSIKIGAADGIQGMLVSLARPGEIPVHRKMTFLAGPNTAMRLAVQETSKVTLPAPFETDCVETWADTTLVAAGQSEDFARRILTFLDYDKDYCEMFCSIIDRWRYCRCFDTEIDGVNLRDLMKSNGVGDGIVECRGWENDTVMQCLIDRETIMGPRTVKEVCGCRDKCEKVEYAVETSHAQWPSEYNWVHVSKWLGQYDLASNRSETEDEKKRRIFGSLLSIQVLLTTRDRHVIRLKPKYETVSSILSTLGGALSVYMGLSFVMLFELVEVAMAAAANRWSKKKAKNPKKTTL